MRVIREPGTGAAVGSYNIISGPDGVHFELRRSDTDTAPFRFVLDPEAAYDLTQDVLRCYDQLVGIAALPPLRDLG